MGPSVYVKVVGFADIERHALNTLFRLSTGRPTSYGLWTPEAPVAPRLALIDLDAYEAGLALASPRLDPDMKMICVGRGAHTHARHTFQRPLHWPDVLKAMDSLFVPVEKLDADVDFSDGRDGVASGFKVSLLVDPSREGRLYLRARLALAGYTHVDEAGTAAQALELAKQRHYDLLIVGLDVPDMEGWVLIRQLVALEPAIGSVIVTTTDKSWQMREHAQASGCSGLLEKPYDPLQLVEMLQKL
ncbi:response regulator [Rhodoferax ferrireducens]|uniref:response regulator n=1 Tax=Rhodoferax ferrireducens TaxID=192843 RepID=UPI000E0CE25C|nr:response regulator [Rhodoferax ferrireducens]